MPKQVIDIVWLIRTGNVRRIPEATFSEYIIAAGQFYKETEQRMGQAYFNALYVLRPDISEVIRGTENDAFYDNDLLPAMLKVVYKKW